MVYLNENIIIFATKNDKPMTEQNHISQFVKAMRKQYGLTQEDLSAKSGVGLRFIRDLEQGKKTLRMDKVNSVLLLFGFELGAVKPTKEKDEP